MKEELCLKNSIGNKLMKKSMRRKLGDELDDLWRSIIYLQFNYICEICGKKITPEECHAHHIILRGNFNVRWDLENGSLLCNYNHNIAENAPHHDNNKYLEWLKDHRPEGHYKRLVRKSGEKGGADKKAVLELMELRDKLKYTKRKLEGERDSSK